MDWSKITIVPEGVQIPSEIQERNAAARKKVLQQFALKEMARPVIPVTDCITGGFKLLTVSCALNVEMDERGEVKTSYGQRTLIFSENGTLI